MVARRAADRLGHLALLERERRLRELLVEEPLRHEPELSAASLRRLVVRERLDDLREVLALLHAGGGLLDLLPRGGVVGAGRHAREDVADADLLLLVEARRVLLVELLDPRALLVRERLHLRVGRLRLGLERCEGEPDERERELVGVGLPRLLHLGVRDLHRLADGGEHLAVEELIAVPGLELRGGPEVLARRGLVALEMEGAVLLEGGDRMDGARELRVGDDDAAALRLLDHELAVHELAQGLLGDAELVRELAGEPAAHLRLVELVELAVLPLPLQRGDGLPVHLRGVGGVPRRSRRPG